MRTISFYSYKGGVGRTLLLAHVARFLVGLGRRVVILDFDFDAPGIPALFGINAFTHSSRGFLDLFLNNRTKANSHSDFMRILGETLLTPTPKNELTIFKGGDVPAAARPWLRILPTGNPGSESYWETVNSPAWLRRFSSGGLRNEVTGFLENILKPALSDLGVDYLLFDSRAGITPYGGVGTMIADHEAVVFCPNPETFDALAYLAPGYQKVRATRISEAERRRQMGLGSSDDGFDLTLVISRVPSELEEAKSFLSSCEKRLSELFPGTKALRFHSDLRTHIDQWVRSPIEALPEEVVSFHEDITKLIARICPNEIPHTARTGALDQEASALWHHAFGRPFSITYVVRVFGLLSDRGEILNPDDKQRNVAFKVDTFLKFLNNFYDAYSVDYRLRGLKKTEEEIEEDIQRHISQTLLKSGTECGDAFGKALVQKFNSQPDDFPTEESRLCEWCRFDTSAGFGLLTLKSPNLVEVSNLFLHRPEITDKRDYGAFFDGYVEGVLNNLLNRRVSVSVNRDGLKTRRYIF